MSKRRQGRPVTPRTGYGARVYQLRLENNLTAQQAAERWGINYRTLYDYEKGKTKIPIDVFLRIAHSENVSADWLAGLTDERGKSR